MRGALTALAAALLALPGLSALSAQTTTPWRSVELARQLHDSQPQRIRVRYGAGRVSVARGPERLLYSMFLRYDEARAEPLHRHDAELHTTTLGLQSRGGGEVVHGRDGDGELRLALSAAIPLDLELALGGTTATLALGGLALRSVRIDCGATAAALEFAEPNRVRLRELEVNLGAASFTGRHLANANADQIVVRGGAGNIDLDFGGRWMRDTDLSVRVAVGKLTLRVPPDVGLRLELRRIAAGFEHGGLVKRDDAWYSPDYDRAPRKLRVRAETVFGAVDVQRSAP